MDKIRVLIADDHPVFRYGLHSLLESDAGVEVVGEASCAAGVLKDIERLHPDIVLLDIRMPGANGIEVAVEVRRTYPDVKILILTAHDDDESLMDALRAGVHGYLLKNASHEILTSVVRRIVAGERVLTPEKLSKVLERFEALARTQARVESDLTTTELRILEHLASGDTYEAMSEQLFLSESTIKRKVQGIVTKMGVSTRTQAVAEALRQGLI